MTGIPNDSLSNLFIRNYTTTAKQKCASVKVSKKETAVKNQQSGNVQKFNLDNKDLTEIFNELIQNKPQKSGNNEMWNKFSYEPPQNKLSDNGDSISKVTTNTSKPKSTYVAGQTFQSSQPQEISSTKNDKQSYVDQPIKTEIKQDKTSVRDTALYKTVDSVGNYASAQGYIDDAMNFATKSTGSNAVGSVVGGVGIAVSGFKIGADSVDFANNFNNRTGRENLRKGTAVAEDVVDGVSGVIGTVHPIAGAATNVVAKGAVRTISQSVEELHDIYNSNADSSTKAVKYAETAADVERKIMVNGSDVVCDTVGGLVKGAAGMMFDDKAAEMVDGFFKDVKETNKENINAVYGMKKNGGAIAVSLATGHTQEAKNLYKDAVGENYYNKTKDVYHGVKDTVNTAKSAAKETVKEVKHTTKKVVNTVAHSEPVKSTVKAVESLPGGKTVVNAAKKAYHWFGF